ncbi:MAG: hypothetical protein WKG00_15115 [Polyangiaceae bacterium]
MGSKGKPYRTIRLDGWEVLVGRGDEDNDYLTFQVGEPHDLWLHVAGGTPGSHVVVRNPDRARCARCGRARGRRRPGTRSRVGRRASRCTSAASPT